ncbi:MAG: hypothetical protein AAF515_12130 [Pseudomonadota bacterium]
MHYFLRFMLLATGFCLFTYGLLSWQADRFTLVGIMPFGADFRWQGLHFLTLGLAMIPPSLWEIFQLEIRAARALGKEPR